MKLIYIVICIFLISCGDNKRSSGQKPSDDEDYDSICYNPNDINEIVVSILTEKEFALPFLIALFDDLGYNRIKLVSNIDHRLDSIEIEGRNIQIVPDSKEQLPRIVLAKGNCQYGKYEFSSKGYSISGTFEKSNEKWSVKIEDVIEID